MTAAPDDTFLNLQQALVGRYSLERELGRGGMGIVYLAHEVALDRPVALKLLPPQLAAQQSLRGRFLQEARTAAKLSHPNIVPIFSVDEVGTFVFFAMGYVDGETLGQRIRSRGPLSASEATRVLREVAWALAYAHAQGVIHRDVKPDNIFLERGSGRTLVMDFGIAHLADGSGQTGVGEVLGTAEYMSPEQASGEPVSPASDIYSLGVVGFLALSGGLPFDGPSVASLLAQHITKPAPPLAETAPDAPRRLTTVIDRCLAKTPTDRYAHGEALADALGRAAVARKEVPVALREFINKNRELGRVGGTTGLIYVLFAPSPVFSMLSWPLNLPIFLFGLLVAGGGVPFVMTLHRIRKVIRVGFGREALVDAFRADIERRLEEKTFEYGKAPSRTERVLRRAGFIGAVLSLTTAGLLIGAPALNHALTTTVLLLSGGVAVVGLAASDHQRYRREDRAGARWLRIWKGAIGRWLFRLSGAGVRQLPPVSPTHRPTEIAIGMAADRLLEDLPRGLRASLGDLPAVVRRLEADAGVMRNEVDELDALIAEATRDQGRTASTAGAAVAAQRDRLVGDLRALRAQAQERMSEAVGALETIRLNLLRLHGGVGDMASITRDLQAALEVASDVDRLVEGRREAERLLKEPRDSAVRAAR